MEVVGRACRESDLQPQVDNQPNDQQHLYQRKELAVETRNRRKDWDQGGTASGKRLGFVATKCVK